MERMKLIRKMAIPAAIIFMISIVVLVAQIPFRNTQYKNHVEHLQAHIDSLTQKYQNYLSETAQKITGLPVDQELISTIQSKFLRESQKTDLYLWMVTTEEAFIFGVPSVAFTRLNAIYDKYQDILERDKHFINRNEFLVKLIDQYEEINFSNFEAQLPFSYEDYTWGDYSSGYYIQPFKYTLSSPVMNASGDIIAELYLRIDDYKNRTVYARRYSLENNDLYATFNPLFGTLAFLSGLFLWFLLPTWVYIDAQQRDVKSPGLWAFLTVISLFFGLTIYLITRPSTFKSFHCPQCENELNGTKVFCPHCGFDLAGTFCPQCQYPIKSNWQFCPNCRAKLGEKQDVETGFAEQKAEE